MAAGGRRGYGLAPSLNPTQPIPEMASLESLHDLFIEELRDLYDAEKQLVQALPLMARAANSEDLAKGFETHLEETREHVRRIEKIFQALGESPEGKHCPAMAGLITEAKETIGEDADPDVLDAALIVAAQKVEHYEIAGYGSVRTFARLLKYGEAATLLETTLKEESLTDDKLTGLAEELNIKAEHAEDAAEIEVDTEKETTLSQRHRTSGKS